MNKLLAMPCKRVGADINGNIYSKETLEKAIEEFNSPKRHRRNLGGLGSNTDGYINPERSSHLVDNMRFDATGEIVLVDIQVLSTPMGRLLENGYRVDSGRFGMSCVGGIDKDKNVELHRIVSVDFIEGETWEEVYGEKCK